MSIIDTAGIISSLTKTAKKAPKKLRKRAIQQAQEMMSRSNKKLEGLDKLVKNIDQTLKNDIFVNATKNLNTQELIDSTKVPKKGFARLIGRQIDLLKTAGEINDKLINISKETREFLKNIQG